MASIVSQIVVVLVNRVLSVGSVNWPRVRRRYYPFYPVMDLPALFQLVRIFVKKHLSELLPIRQYVLSVHVELDQVFFIMISMF